MKAADLPEPAWWKRARKLRESYSVRETAKILGKSDTAVQYAVNDKSRAAAKARSKRYEEKRSKPCGVLDIKRHKIRALARENWRKEQYSKPLDYYYRELECL